MSKCLCRKPDVAGHICNPSTPKVRWAAEAGESSRSLWASQPGVCSTVPKQETLPKQVGRQELQVVFWPQHAHHGMLMASPEIH